MTKLPRALRYSPYAFYVVAFFLGAYNFLAQLQATWAVDSEVYLSPHTDAFEGFQYLVTSQPFAYGISEAAYMGANGVLAHLLIKIFDRLGDQVA